MYVFIIYNINKDNFFFILMSFIEAYSTTAIRICLNIPILHTTVIHKANYVFDTFALFFSQMSDYNNKEWEELNKMVPFSKR